MKKYLLISFLLIFGQLSAQTFEKIIKKQTAIGGITSICFDQNDNSYFNIESIFVGSFNFGLGQETQILKLDIHGDIIQSTELKPSDLNSTFDNKKYDLSITHTEIHGSQMTHYGNLHIDSNRYSLIKLFTKKDLSIDSFKLFSTISDSIRNFIGKENTILFGSKINLNIGIEFGNIAIEQLDSINEISLFSDQKSMWNGAIEDFVNSKEFSYILATEYSGPPSYLIEGPTLTRLDTNFSFNKRVRLGVSTRHSSEYSNVAIANGSTKLLNDSTLLTVFASVNNIDTVKGDLHLFLHDLDLNQTAYKRIVTTDTNLSSYVNCMVFDSTNSTFYIGVTQTLTDEGNHFQNQAQTWLRLFKFDKNLNLIWDKSYKRDSTTIVLNYMALDQFGQITMAGGYEDSTTRANGFTRNVYILRVDSNGNFNRTDLLESIIPKRDILVYPIPANDVLTFKKFNRFVPYQLQIFNMNGKLEDEVDWMYNQMQINLTNYKTGTYIYCITDSDGRKLSGLFIKK